MSFFEDLAGDLLKEGGKGEKIAALQKTLKSVGVDPGNPDGVFGPKTKQAVTAFQKKMGLDTDGVVGPNTAKKLKEAAMKALKGDGAGDAKGAVQDIMGQVGGLFGGGKK